MKRHLISVQALNYGISHTKTINRNIQKFMLACFKEGDAGDGGYDLSTKEGVEGFLSENTKMILELPEFKEAQKTIKELKTANSELEKKMKNSFTKDSEEFKNLLDEVKKNGLDMKSLRDKSDTTMKFKRGSLAAYLEKNKSKIDALCAAKGTSLMLEYKAFEDATSIGSGDSFNTVGRDAYFTWHEGGAVGRIPVRRPFMRELFRNVTVGTEWIKYIDQATVVRNASNVAYCGTTTSNTAVTFAVHTIQIQKVRDFISICLDMMSDYGFVQGEINRLLHESLDLQIDGQLLNGTGVGSFLNGVLSVASTFNAAANGASFAGTVSNAQLIDLISIAGAQIRLFGQMNAWYPNCVLINPVDLQGIKALKNSFGDYIRNNQLISSLWTDGKGTYYVDGMILIENPLIPQNTFTIGDFTKGTVYSMPGVGIEFSYENRQNFETETVTVKIYERLNLLIRNVDKNAFMTVKDIGAGIQAINKGVTP